MREKKEKKKEGKKEERERGRGRKKEERRKEKKGRKAMVVSGFVRKELYAVGDIATVDIATDLGWVQLCFQH